MEKFFNKIPLWVINALSIISAILTILTTIFTLFFTFKGWEKNHKFIFLTLGCFVVLTLVRMRKYKKISFDRHEKTSFLYHKLTHDSRDLYFDIMRSHKEKREDIRNLTEIYQNRLSSILTYLCDIMEIYCGQKMSACIKLITHPDEKFDNITLTTFCRSNMSDTNRGSYERASNKQIKLSDNTDFLYILNPNNDSNLNYFYQGNLKEYSNELKKQGKQYMNTNANWENDYIGTIVVPIQIEHKRLYDSAKEDSFYVIGFLCIDSKSSSAFLKRQEKFNVDMVKSFADIFYMLLSQYHHYLKKLSKK